MLGDLLHVVYSKVFATSVTRAGSNHIWYITGSQYVVPRSGDSSESFKLREKFYQRIEVLVSGQVSLVHLPRASKKKFTENMWTIQNV